MNIQSLSVSERILLAEQLWDSVRTRSDEVKIPAELVELLDERLAELAEDGSLGDDWDTVKKRISSASQARFYQPIPLWYLLRNY